MSSVASPGPAVRTSASPESPVSSVSWSAVAGGAFVTASVSLALMALGAGAGLSAISPWPNAGAPAKAVAPVAIIWVILVQAIACALGGYLAGRLRTKWVSVHSHEVYFRDTAHGFLVWAVGLVISVAFFSSIGVAVAKDAARAHGEGRGDYYVDTLFRTPHPSLEGAASDAAVREEAAGILTRALAGPEIPAADETYLSGLVASRTGLPQPEAQARVRDTVTAARQSLDASRKAVAHSLYWLCAAFLIGAFSASFAATIGGRQRDHVYA